MFNRFKNKDDKFAYKGIVIEGIIVSATEYLMLGAFVLVNFLINHYYGTDVVGVYAISYAIAQIGIMGIGSVFSLLIRRDLSLDQYDPNSYVARVQILRSCNLGLVLLLSAAVILAVYPPLRPSLIFILLMIGGKGLDALSETYYSTYQTMSRLGDYSFFKSLHAVAFIAVSVFICLRRIDIEYLYIGQLACSAVMFAINYFRWQQTKQERSADLVTEPAGYRFLLIESYPLMVSAMIFQLGQRANNLLIFDKLGEKELGMFSLVLITVGIFTGAGNTLAIVFFGRLSRIFVEQRDAFFRRLHQTIALFLGSGIALTAIYLVAVPIGEMLFGMIFDMNLYRVMAAAIPFLFVVSCLGTVFTVIRKQKVGMYLTVVVLLVNVFSYYYLTEIFGLIGAGYAYLISAIFQSILVYLGVMLTLRRTPNVESTTQLVL